ncbi:MAG: hypothetical protein IIC87_05695 [Chloroflexi bacterium]|nr:hypothetical protein [Chloroflexota bacterium]
MLESGKKYYQFVREERLFCGALTHLLMQKGSNLTTFLQLVDAKLPADSKFPIADLESAEIYVEFAFLRDYWHSLERDNSAKRSLIFDLLSKVSLLRHYQTDSFPSAIAEFNTIFMGAQGESIKNDIASPGRWSVTSLFERFGAQPDEFRDFCRFKWSFNIKPDIVVLLPGSKPLCIEAKLESKEGRYPTKSNECDAFDKAFGKGQGRVAQIELQQFMFGTLLDAPCQSVFIGRTASSQPHSISLSWQQIFAQLDTDTSIGFVGKLLRGNRHLKPTASTRRTT